MATVSGQVIFDLNRSSTLSPGDPGIANVPVILQNIETGARLVVLTDTSGNYAFINVPNGNYRIVEAFGTAGGVLTPGDFSTATLGPVPIATTPPISFVSNPPIGSTNLDSTTPNTVLITVTDNDITNQNILNGPVIYTPIQNILDPCVTVSDTNLITDADNGTFGFFLAGTPANTGPATEPYPGVTPDFTYVVPDPTTYTPIDGEYTVQNILNNAMSNQIGAWWRIADHTTGNETGRMMIVNGFNPGAVFFESTVNVTPNTNYLFSTWILNLFTTTGYPPAQLGVRILDQNGNNLYQAALGELIPVNTTAPEWREIGTVINSQNNTQLTVEFFSEGEAVIGNDYAIDDVSLKEVEIPTLTPVKSISTPTATIGDIATYTIQLTNTCRSPLTNVFFTDIIPNGLVFVLDSVTVNNNPFLGVDPNIGFALPDIAGGTSVEVTFNVRVENLPNPNPIDNSAVLNYSYTPVEGGIPNNFSVESNPVPLLVENEPEADITVVKGASSNPVQRGELLTYTMFIQNDGPDDAENVILTDNIPDSIIEAEYSIDGGLTLNPWEGSLDLGTFVNGESRPILIRGIVSNTASGTISNTAIVSSTTPDSDPNDNESTASVTVEPEADVSVVKSASPSPVQRGELLTYTIVVTNDGPDDARAVYLNDSLPLSLLNPEFSLDNGATFRPLPPIYPISLSTIEAGGTRNVIVRGIVSDISSGTISNTAILTSITPDPNPDNNTSTVDVEIEEEQEADLSVTKQSSVPNATPGEEFIYTITISNNGPNVAQDVLLTDIIPTSVLNPEFSLDGVNFQPWTGRLNLDTVAPGQVITVIIRGTISPDATGVITNTAVINSSTPDPNFDNNTSTIENPITPIGTEADLSLIKQSNILNATPGEAFSYTITVSNAGPDAAQDVILTDTIPILLLNPEFSLDGVNFQPWTGRLNLDTVAPGQVVTIIIRGTVSPDATGVISNTAIINSSTPDPNFDNNNSTIENPITPIGTEADLTVVKRSNTPIVISGGPISYAITVSNTGPDTAQNVLLTDVIPSSVLNSVFSLDGGATFQPWEGNLNLGTIPPGQVITIIIRGTVSPDATGMITNTAVINSSTPDTNFDNNTSTIETIIKPAVIPSADISIVKLVNKRKAFVGDCITFKIIISNAGPLDAENVILIDNVTDFLKRAVVSTDNRVTYDPWKGLIILDNLPAGTSKVIFLSGIILPTSAHKIINTANVFSTTPDSNLKNNTSTVTVKIMKGCPDHCHHYDSTDNDCYCPDSYPSNYPYCESDD